MDSGGKVAAGARQRVQGRDKVAPGILSHMAQMPQGTTVDVIEVNGLPALLVRVNGQIASVLTLEVEGDFIHTLRTVLNPDKLAHLKLPPTPGQEWRLASAGPG
jgi:RNA polymerase sigma-70 factor (ECF subfamily)